MPGTDDHSTDDQTQAAAGAWRSTLIVTGSDAGYYPLASELIASIRRCAPEAVSIGYYDFGLTDDQAQSLRQSGVLVRAPRTGLDLGGPAEQWRAGMGYLSRPFLRENFPGHDIYVWLDADVWLQHWDGMRALHDTARATGAALVREDERAYRFWPWLVGWRLKHFVRGYGVAPGAWLASRRHINNGVFAMRADAPHWEPWRRRYQRAFDRTRTAGPHDQFSLNAAVYLDRLPTGFMPATCNWICDLAAPMWNVARGMYCVPYAPHAPIGMMHLAGPAKTATFDIRATDGTTRRTGLRYAPGRLPACAAA